MYLSCPTCNTSFVVTAEQIGPNGRRVRCSKCNHGWFAEPQPGYKRKKSPEATSSSIQIVPRRIGSTEVFKPGVNLPALLPINIPLYLYIIPAILATAIILSTMMLFQDKMTFMGLVGTSDKLKVHDINIEYDKTQGNIIASYKVVNLSSTFIPLSNIRIRLLDSNHRVLKSHIATETSSTLAPQQYVTIRTNFVEAPTNVEFIDITLGNKLDFLLR